MKNSFSKKALLLGAGAAILVKFIRGDGIFNGVRFYSERKAVETYLANYYPCATFSDLVKAGDSLSCVVNSETRRFLLKIHKTDDGNFVFGETDL